MGWQVQGWEKVGPVLIALPFQAVETVDLRYYYPDFVVKTDLGEMWLVETKGQESLEVAFKDRAAKIWCENATKLAGEQWRYVKVPQKEYVKLKPVEFYDLLTFV